MTNPLVLLTGGEPGEPESAGSDLDAFPDRFLDRELSWLRFNRRVLELAEDDSLPLLERVRFLAIFTRNLDEFFMVRVAGLKRRIAAGVAVRAASGLMPREELEAIWAMTASVMALASRSCTASSSPAGPAAGRSCSGPGGLRAVRRSVQPPVT